MLTLQRWSCQQCALGTCKMELMAVCPIIQVPRAFKYLGYVVDHIATWKAEITAPKI